MYNTYLISLRKKDNFVDNIINKIIDIDQRAWELKSSTEKRLKENENYLKRTLSKMEEEILEEGKKMGKEKYDRLIEEGRRETERIAGEAEEICGYLEERFKSIHKDLVEELFSKIIEYKSP
ncbi:MAG: hypothetical protein AB2421_13220 [Thermotaleaceae bacterium]